jgi:threonine/homoserine/homoserine lactone efflux protein
MTALLLGILGGFFLSVPPGPLSISVTKQGLGGDFRAGINVVLGAALMDVVYCLLSTFATSAIVVALSALVMGNPWFPLAFQMLCVVVLVVLGVRYLTPKRSDEARTLSTRKEEAQEQRAVQMGHSSPFFVGILIAVTNLATPTFIPSIVAFVGYLHANQWLPRGAVNNMIFSVGFGLGTTLWFFIFLRLLMHFRHRLSAGFVASMYRFAGTSLLFFAVVLIYYLFTSTSWTTLL